MKRHGKGFLNKGRGWTLCASAVLTAALAAYGPAAAPVSAAEPAKQERRHVAIVIDDFGNRMNGTDEMLKLPVKITAAVMPFMPTTREDAELAHRLGHDVIVHMPMEPNKGLKSWLGPGAITTDLPDEEIRRRVEKAIDDVPYAIGMNNHMGSKATADGRVMRIVLTVCKERGLFFLDSRTTWKTVIPEVAKEVGVPLASNEIFLDDVYSERHIMKQVVLLKKHLESHDNCIIIGHVGAPGKKTAAVLQQSIPDMQSYVEFVKLRSILSGLPGQPFILPNP